MKRRNFLQTLSASALVPFFPASFAAKAAAPSVTDLIAAHHARAGTLGVASIGARYGLNPAAASTLAGRLRAAGFALGSRAAAATPSATGSGLRKRLSLRAAQAAPERAATAPEDADTA